MTEPDADLLELPFDQYQRYSVTALVLRGLGIAAGARVLDVGGGPGPIERFLPDYSTYVVDFDKSRAGLYLNASGAALPFRDRSFSAVVTFDTLEHVPAQARADFLRELQRVAGDVVVVTAPFADSEVELAEAAVSEFYTARFGLRHEMLGEHVQHGLPDLESTEDAFRASGWAVTTFPSGYLPRWLAAMLVQEELRATGFPHLGKLHAYYNATISPFDCREPAYRRVILASRTREAAALRAIAGSLTVDEDPALSRAAVQALASAVFSQRLVSVLRASEIVAHEVLEMKVSDLERQIADRDAHLVELRSLNQKLLEQRSSPTRAIARRITEWRTGRSV